MSRRVGLVAAIVVTAALAGASSAHAVTVGIGNPPSGFAELGIGSWEAGERNDITVTPSGAVPRLGVVDPAYALMPTSVEVRDATTPLSVDTAGCVLIDAHTARCTAPQGFGNVYANLGPGGDSSFTLEPGATGAATPLDYQVWTHDGDDRVSIPLSRGVSVDTHGGADTIDVADQDAWYGRISAGAGDDRVRLTAPRTKVDVDCGDGIDVAVILSTASTNTGCETVMGAP